MFVLYEIFSYIWYVCVWIAIRGAVKNVHHLMSDINKLAAWVLGFQYSDFVVLSVQLVISACIVSGLKNVIQNIEAIRRMPHNGS